MKNRLIWRLYPSYLIITFLSLAAVLWYTSTTVEKQNQEQAVQAATESAELVRSLAAQYFKSSQIEQLDTLLNTLTTSIADDIVILDKSGKSIAGTDLTDITDFSDYPEIERAMRGQTGENIGYSSKYNSRILHIALPIIENGKTMYVVRVSRILPESGLFMTDLRRNVFAAGAVVALLAAVVSFAISRFISRPLEEIRVGAERYARGDLQYTLPVHGSDEMKTLSRAMNEMASQLDDRLRTVIRQRNEQQAILSSLVEGVLAVNTREQIISMNEGAEKLLGIKEDDAKGRTIQEVIRNSDLQTLVQRTLTEKEPTEGMIVLENAGEKHFQGYTAILHDSEGEMFGALVVLNDLTRIRKLENLRRDFVANVSHELKTPITTIKGFVETLVDGAISRPEESKRFLNIIAKQVDRLSGIIDDLLSLSWIEDEAGKGTMEKEPHQLREVLKICIDACEIMRKQKEITIALNCPEQIHVTINAPLLEQAIINLIDNALKYSDNGKTVTVTAQQTSTETTIAVTDEGSGIPAEHLPRLFERFYRVDKARSRKLGGTGLGLSIVKHIVLVHGGTVDVTSLLGVGTTFTIHLPHNNLAANNSLAQNG